MKILENQSCTKNFQKIFFRPTTYFQKQKNFVQGTTFVQFFMYLKAKKFGVIRKILNRIFFPGTKKVCPRDNFCSVFYVFESKIKKFRSDQKFFEFFHF